MSDNRPSRPARISVKQWTAIVLAVAALVFILQNLYRVRVQLFFFHATAPLWAVLLATLALGYLIGRFSSRR